MVTSANPLSVTTGFVVSWTETFRVTWAELGPSETLYVSTYLPGVLGSTEPDTWITLVRFPAHASEAVAPGSVKPVWHSTIIGFTPRSVMTGGVVSFTTTVRD